MSGKKNHRCGPIQSHIPDTPHTSGPCPFHRRIPVKMNRFIVHADALGFSDCGLDPRPTSRSDTPWIPRTAHAPYLTDDLSRDKCCVQVPFVNIRSDYNYGGAKCSVPLLAFCSVWNHAPVYPFVIEFIDVAVSHALITNQQFTQTKNI